MKVRHEMKFKLWAVILGLTMAIPGAVIGIAQGQNDQAPYSDSKPSPNIQMQTPGDQGMDQDITDQDSGLDQDLSNQPPSNPPTNQSSVNRAPSAGPNDPGSYNSGSDAPSYNTPAPAENNGVARISLIHGDVSTQRGDSKDWSAAALNAPVLAGDRISTGDKARTELELDYANTLRLAEHSEANITQLTRSQIQIQLGHGMANYTVYKGSDADAEIDTPNVAIRTERRESSFRILVTADDHTEVLVRKGEVEVTTPQGGTRVGQGQFITIAGVGDQAQYKIGEAPVRDDWDQWNTDRDNMIRNSEARRHTNDYYVGAENLDGKGTWSEVPDYGQVWRPNEPADWAPYRDGRWVYEPYWGWTWVSSDDWGWAPYHYGRWMYVDGGWGWWPGPAYGYPFYRPIWAPAYVSFFGYGGGFGVGFGVGFGGWGGIGWLPLGPCDHFHPWWGRWGGGRFGEVGFRDFNRGGFAPLHGGNRFSNVNLAMHDRNFRGATSVSGREFGTGHMNAHAMGHAELQNAHFSTGRLPVSPSRASFSASGRAAAPSTIRSGSQNQHFFSAQGQGQGTNRGSIGSAANGRSSNGRSNGNSLGNSQGARPWRSGGSEERGNSSAQSGSRLGNSGGSMPGRTSGNSGGWQRFSPMAPRSAAESNRSESNRSESSRSESMRGNESRGSMGRPSMGGSSSSMSRPSMGPSEQRGYSTPRSSGPISRNYGAEGRGYGGYSRPQLNMRQPIVAPRSSGGPYGGGRSAPSYSGRSAPSFGGGRSAPSGGGHSAPSSHGGGGGSSHGGGVGGSHGGGGGGSHGGGGGGGGRHGR